MTDQLVAHTASKMMRVLVVAIALMCNSAMAAPLSGTLANKPFKVAKAQLRITPEQTTLSLYSWKQGGPCDPQFAPDDDQLYIEVSAPDMKAKTPITERVIYKTPHVGHLDGVHLSTTFDSIGADRAKGTLTLDAPDGTHVTGTFDAAVCTSAQKAPKQDPVLLGLKWGATDVELPKQAVTTTIVGETKAPIAVELIDWSDAGLSQHEIHFFTTKPTRGPCRSEQVTPGFKVSFAKSPKPGFNAKVTTDSASARGAAKATVIWSEPGDVASAESSGHIEIAIDSVTDKDVRGRVFAWMNDASKSMLAGAFVATNCHAEP